MLASRLLSILMLLQTRGRMSAPELADEFEVSVRTIHRDIDQLSAAGIPVYADRGRFGGFQLLGGYRTRLTGLTAPEAETLLMAGLPGPAAEMGIADLLSAARLKLMAAMPAGAQAERIAARFHLDPAGWFRASESVPLLPVVARAVWSERRMRMAYRSGGALQPREVAPLGMVLKGGLWYLVALRGGTIRTYRVASIAEADILEKSFNRPKGFDLAAHWTASSRAFERESYREKAVVRLSPEGRRWIGLLGSHVAQSVNDTARPAKKGWIECEVPLESLSIGIRELMRLGPHVEVLAPETLRVQMAQTLQQMQALYADDLSDRKRSPRKRPARDRD
ncbi:MAG: YafY family transcriptional regulator [Alphaproteobacteria bacterium]|nr:YafY family transcriptional regulator [Alphaproteobacteria bacterium]